MSTTSLQPQVAPVNEIRSHFPALERVHNGYPVAYFDGPGGTQVPRYVVEKMADYLYHHNANTHWAYPTSAETDAALEHAREVYAQFLNASRAEIAFGANMTTLTLHLARALGLSYKPGDEIVVTMVPAADGKSPIGLLVAITYADGHTVRFRSTEDRCRRNVR